MTIFCGRYVVAVIAAAVGLMLSGESGVSAEDKPAENDRRVTLAEGKIVLDAPKTWVRRAPKNKIIEHEFAILSGQDEKPEGRFTVMGAGGSVEANVTRWLGQFVQTDGSATKDKAKVEKRKIAGVEVHYVDVAGDFKDSPGPFAPAVMRPDYRMLAAIIVTDKLGQHFLKFYGPKEVVAANEKAFEEMLNSLQLK